MNPNELTQNIISAMAKGHAYDQLVLQQQIQQKDQRISQLERENDVLKKQLAAVVPPVAAVAAAAE